MVYELCYAVLRSPTWSMWYSISCRVTHTEPGSMAGSDIPASLVAVVPTTPMTAGKSFAPYMQMTAVQSSAAGRKSLVERSYKSCTGNPHWVVKLCPYSQ